MTHKQRILAAIRRQDIDRVPHATYNIHPYHGSVHRHDASYGEILDQIGLTAGAMAKVNGDLPDIGLSACADGVAETLAQDAGDGRTETVVIHAPRGDLIRQVRVPQGQPPYTIKHFIETDEDIEAYLSLPYSPPELNIDEIRAVHSSLGENGIVFVTYTEPMYETACLFDFEDFCIRCLTDTAAIKRMIDWGFERCIENVKRLVDACRGMDVVLHTSGPEVCTPPMLAPSFFAEFVTPYISRFTDVIHEAGLLSAIHCHGRMRDVFAEMIKTGADLLEPIEPEPQGDIGLAELMERAEGRISLMGHVQDQEFYNAGSGSVTAWVEHVARIISGRTGYVMSPTCTPFEFPCGETYRKNYLEWLQAADRLL